MTERTNLNIGNGLSAVDIDTFKRDQERLRLARIGGFEIANPEKGTWGEVGGATQAEVGARIAREGGYNRIQDLGVTDTHGRPIVRALNNAGEDYATTLYNAGIVQGQSGELDAAAAGVPALTRIQEKERLRLGLGPSKLEEARMEVAGGIRKDYSDMGLRAFTMKELAPTQLAATQQPDRYYGAATRQVGTDREGYSTSPFTEGFFGHGWNNAKQQYHGLMDMLGHATGSKDLQEFSQGKIAALQFEKGSDLEPLRPMFKPGAKVDITDPASVWDALDIKSPAKATNFLLGALGQSLPYMIPMLLNPAAGLAQVATRAAPGLMYTADTWNEQPENDKNALRAIISGAGQATLDRLGLDIVLNRFPIKNGVRQVPVWDKATRELAIDQMVATGKAATKEQAAKMVDETIGGVMKEMFVTGMKRAALAVPSEAVTEVGQEVIGIWGKTGAVDFKDSETQKQLLEAGLAGGALGGALGGGAGVRAGIARAGAKKAAQVSDAELSDILKVQTENQQAVEERLRNQAKGVESLPTYGKAGFSDVRDAQQQARQSAMPEKFKGMTLKQLGDQAGGEPNVLQKMWDVVSFKQLIKSALPSPINPVTGEVRPIVALMHSKYGGPGSQMYVAGANDETKVLTRQGEYLGKITPEAMARTLNMTPEDFEKLAADVYRDYISKGLPVPNIGPHTATLEKFFNESRAGFNRAKTDAELNAVPFHDDYDTIMSGGYQGRSADAAVRKNLTRLTNYLTGRGFTKDLAEKALKEYTGPDRGASIKARKLLADHGMFSEPSLKDVFEGQTGIFKSLADVATNYARRNTEAEYWGKDGENVLKDLAYAVENGEITREEAIRAANILDKKRQMIQGTFNEINSETVKKLYSYGSTAVILTLMGKATFSNLVEIGAASIGQEHKLNFIGKAAKEFLREAKNDYKTMFRVQYGYDTLKAIQAGMQGLPANPTLQQRVDYWSDIYNDPNTDLKKLDAAAEEIEKVALGMERQVLDAIGLGSTAAHFSRYDFDKDFTESQTKMIHFFTKLTLLVPLTTATRLATIGGVSDLMFKDIELLRKIPREKRDAALLKGEGLTREQRWAYNNLTSIGAPIGRWVQLADKFEADNRSGNFLEVIINTDEYIDGQSEEMHELATEIHEAMANAVNQKMANPGFGNVPAWWNRPWAKPLTLLKRFVATFNSVVLPQMYKQLFSSDSHTAPRYDVFVTAMTMYLFGLLGNMGKDLITWGDEDKHRKVRYQRALYATGLLGPLQSNPLKLDLDTFAPVFGQPVFGIGNIPKGGADAALRSVGSLAGSLTPAATVGANLWGVGSGIVTGDTAKAVSSGLALTPIIGASKEFGINPIAERFR